MRCEQLRVTEQRVWKHQGGRDGQTGGSLVSHSILNITCMVWGPQTLCQMGLTQPFASPLRAVSPRSLVRLLHTASAQKISGTWIHAHDNLSGPPFPHSYLKYFKHYESEHVFYKFNKQTEVWLCCNKCYVQKQVAAGIWPTAIVAGPGTNTLNNMIH